MNKVGEKTKIIISVILVIILVGGIISFQVYEYYTNQVKKQQDKEIISVLKNKIDFSPFEEELAKYSENDFEKMDELFLEKTIDEIQSEVKGGKVTCEQVVLYYINRIKKYDSYYNSVIRLNPVVLKEAREQDQKLKKK